MIKIDIKPLSVNEVWKGRRFKTKAYSDYEEALILLLPDIELPEPPYSVEFEFGLSNSGADWDNPIKPIQDVLQKRYGFNDKHVMYAKVKKTVVKKGSEFVKFKIDSYLPE